MLVCDVEDIYGSLREGARPLLPAARLEQDQATKGDGVACTESVKTLLNHPSAALTEDLHRRYDGPEDENGPADEEDIL